MLIVYSNKNQNYISHSPPGHQYVQHGGESNSTSCGHRVRHRGLRLPNKLSFSKGVCHRRTGFALLPLDHLILIRTLEHPIATHTLLHDILCYYEIAVCRLPSRTKNLRSCSTVPHTAAFLPLRCLPSTTTTMPCFLLPQASLPLGYRPSSTVRCLPSFTTMPPFTTTEAAQYDAFLPPLATLPLRCRPLCTNVAVLSQRCLPPANTFDDRCRHRCLPPFHAFLSVTTVLPSSPTTKMQQPLSSVASIF